MITNRLKKAFWFQSNPITVSSIAPKLISRNTDIEGLLAYDSNGNVMGHPKENGHYAKIKKFYGGKLVTIVNGGFITPSDSREPYEYDVYASSKKHASKTSSLVLV